MPQQLVKQSKNNLVPQSIDAEEAILGAVLTSSTAYAKIADMIISQDFYKPANREVYEAMFQKQNSMKCKSEMRKGEEYVCYAGNDP